MMTTTKNSKRKNQPNGVDINQFPKLGAAIDEAVASCSTGWRVPRASPIWS